MEVRRDKVERNQQHPRLRNRGVVGRSACTPLRGVNKTKEIQLKAEENSLKSTGLDGAPNRVGRKAVVRAPEKKLGGRVKAKTIYRGNENWHK